MPEQLTSANFSFLAAHDAQLVRLGALAERYFKDDPATCLIKLRQYGETLAQLVAAKSGLFRDAQEPQTDLLRRLKFERVIPREVGDLFHHLRIVGNKSNPRERRQPRRGPDGAQSGSRARYLVSSNVRTRRNRSRQALSFRRLIRRRQRKH